MSLRSSSGLPVLYLHCGGFKTGTSSIQGFFSIHRQEILKKYKLLYPLAARRINSGVRLPGQPKDACYAHHQLAHIGRKVLVDPQAGQRMFIAQADALKQEFVTSGADSLFLSTELLTSCSQKIRNLILSQFSNFDIKILYSVRHPSDYIESMNNQILGAGGQHLCEPVQLPFLRTLDAWVKDVGRGNVHVFSFSPLRFPQYAQEFFDAVEIPGFAEYAVPRLPRVNGSMSLEGVTVRGLLKHHLPDSAALNPVQRHDINSMLDEIGQALVRRTPLVTLTPADRIEIDENNAPMVHAIIERYLAPAGAGFLRDSQSPRASAEKNLGDPCHFTGADIRMILAKLIEIKIIEPIAAGALDLALSSLSNFRKEFGDESLFDREDLERILKIFPPAETGVYSLAASKENLMRNIRRNTGLKISILLFRAMRNRVTRAALQRLPARVRRGLAELLSCNDFHAQALTLEPDPLKQPALRAGIFAPFNERNADFSPDFTFYEGIAFLSSSRSFLPSAPLVAQWLRHLHPKFRERVLAFLCQVGFEDFGVLLPLISAQIPTPRWLSDRIAPAKTMSPARAKGCMASVARATDPNNTFLAYNRLKRSGRSEQAAILLEQSFVQLGLASPPGDLHQGYNPPRPSVAAAEKDVELPKISIILCVWNAEKFLPVALSSIVDQTYPNLEIIAIDDGSDDGSATVLEKWLGERFNATIIHQAQNLGVYACRNLGLERATGEYVTFHDADDWSSPEKIELQWKAIAGRRGALASSSDWVRLDAQTGLCFTRRVYPLCRWNCSSFMFHRATALESLGFYDPVRAGGDSEYVARFEAFFGPHRHVRVRLPLSIGLEHQASLTGDPASGFDGSGLSAQRQAYRESWRAWHSACWNQPGRLRLERGQSIGGSPGY